MKKINFKRILLLPVVALAFMLAFLQFKSAAAQETLTADQTWGPQNRASFTWDSPADYVTFNSMTNTPTMILEMIGMLLGRLEIFIVIIGFTFGFRTLKDLFRRS